MRTTLTVIALGSALLLGLGDADAQIRGKRFNNPFPTTQNQTQAEALKDYPTVQIYDTKIVIGDREKTEFKSYLEILMLYVIAS